MNATVTSPEKLSNEDKKSIEKLLVEKFGKIEIVYHTKPELFGGLRIEVGDWVFDGSVAKELNQLVNVLKS